MASAHVFLPGEWGHECSDEHFLQTGSGNNIEECIGEVGCGRLTLAKGPILTQLLTHPLFSAGQGKKIESLWVEITAVRLLTNFVMGKTGLAWGKLIPC